MSQQRMLTSYNATKLPWKRVYSPSYILPVIFFSKLLRPVSQIYCTEMVIVKIVTIVSSQEEEYSYYSIHVVIFSVTMTKII